MHPNLCVCEWSNRTCVCVKTMEQHASWEPIKVNDIPEPSTQVYAPAAQARPNRGDRRRVCKHWFFTTVLRSLTRTSRSWNGAVAWSCFLSHTVEFWVWRWFTQKSKGQNIPWTCQLMESARQWTFLLVPPHKMCIYFERKNVNTELRTSVQLSVSAAVSDIAHKQWRDFLDSDILLSLFYFLWKQRYCRRSWGQAKTPSFHRK